MALKIRLQRHGASHRPFYRMVVTEAAARRDGRFVEVLGTYEPQASKPENELLLKLERIDYWKSVGAKPTDTAASLIRQARRGPVVRKPKKSKKKKNAEATATAEVEEAATEVVAEAEAEVAAEAPVEAEAAPAEEPEATAEEAPAEEPEATAEAAPAEEPEATAEEAPAEEPEAATEASEEAPAGPDCGCGKTADANGKCDGSHAKKDEPAEEQAESQEEKS